MTAKRTFTVVGPTGTPDKVYEGFDRNFDAVGLEHVVLVTVDGEIDIYAVDSPKTVSPLVKYLAEKGGNVKLLGCYSRS